jgi:cell division septation protein DedD
MMLLTIKPIRLLSLGVLILTCGFAWQGAPVTAQSGNFTSGPAEFPPASYTGRQYVDSKGCVFVRAGVDGAVTWVPRVSRSRQQICGAVPTQVAGAGPAAPTRRSAALVVLPPAGDLNPADTEAAVAAVAAPAPAGAAVRSAAQPAARVAAQPASVPAPRPQPARAAAPRIESAATRRNDVVIVAPVRTASPVIVAAPAKIAAPRVPAPRLPAAACTNLSPIGQAYVRPGAGVRCGPQKASPVGRSIGGRLASVSVLSADTGGLVITGQTRVVPRHVAAMQAQSADLAAPPPGYRLVWEDDRLNPRRAHQTLDGRDQMYLRWTRDVPQRLVDIRTGADVTAFNPDLVFPFVSRDAQNAAAAAAAQGRRVIVVSSQSRQPLIAPADLPMVATAGQPRVSTSAPQRQSAGLADSAAGAAAYVQVGSFANPANAAATTARLQALGLPVAEGRLTRGGRLLTVVLTGPFSTSIAVNSALGRARAAGFSDAFVRR